MAGCNCCNMKRLRMAAVVMTLVCMTTSGVLRGVSATKFCQRVIQPLGYDCTEFTVQTDDGFVLVMHRLSRGDWPTSNGDNITDDGRNKDKDIREKSRAGQSSTTSNSHDIGAPRSTVVPTLSPDGTLRDSSFSSSRSRRSGRPVRKLLSAMDNSSAAPAANVNSQAHHELDEPSIVVQPDNCSPVGRDVPAQPPISSVPGAAQTSPTAARHQTSNQRHSTSGNSTASEGNGTSSQPPASSSPGTEAQLSPPAATSPASNQRHSNSDNTTVSEGSGTTSVQPPTSSHNAQPSPTAASSPASRPGHSNSGNSTVPEGSGVSAHANTPTSSVPHEKGQPAPTAASSPTSKQQPSISANSTVSEGPAASSTSAKLPAPEPLSSIGPPDAFAPQQSPSSIPATNPRTNVTTDSESSNVTGSTEKAKAQRGAPVLLMHQEFLNGDSWFKPLGSQNQSRLLPLMLFDEGFDVWIGHQRATYWGHDHAQLGHTETAYWNWTWDEHAQYDLPAQLRFIAAETNQTIHFIGASQAGTVGAAGATDPVIASMLRSLTLIGPTMYRGNSNSLLLDAWAYYFGLALDSEYLATGFQNGAFNYSNEFPPVPIRGDGVTGLAIGLISGPNCCLGSTTIELNNGWDGTTSFKNLLHWQQGIRKNSFAHYDYNDVQRNMIAYRQSTAPVYNPALIPKNLPVLVVSGGRDWTAPALGLNQFVSQLRGPAQSINLTNYAHYDLTFSVNREKDIYLPIVSFLESSQFDGESSELPGF